MSLPNINELWHNTNPTIRRVVTVGAIAVCLVTLVAIFQPSDKARTSRKDPTAVQENVLLDKNTRQVTLDSMAARIGNLEDSLAKKEQKIERLEEDLKRKQRETAPATDPERSATEMQLQELQKRVGDLQQKVADQDKAPTPAQGGQSASDRATIEPGKRPGSTSGATQAGFRPHAAPPTPAEMYEKGAQPSGQVQPTSGTAADRTDTAVSAPQAAADIRVVVEEVPDTPADEMQDETAQNYLPAGSIFSGTLITGMDAPTSNNARREPFPALLRIKHDAILPNRWKADVKECFLLAAGFGDLSSERAYLRGEVISCVTKQGKVLEANFPAYAVGEDGKAGVRGRLVSKQGQVIGRALMAGFLDGVSKAFDVKPVPVLATSNTGKTQYADVFAGEQSLRSAAFGGASSALDKIAQFYLDMAGNIFPIIEVDAGRKIDLIATRGISLTFKKKGKEQALQDMRLPGQGQPNSGGGGGSGLLGSMFGFGGNAGATGTGSRQ
ncbi:TrbI/VirB10 family protein [Azospirillum argentinense]|uniref:Conjugal transfer protein TraB n=1 Tax=Azospirillum argentinense TaxID=2970906 RepID=A0A5B0KNK6_9PROT|nr:TrbI/VirB10 family protein [Azospirillum argentinense]KAA1053859.1 IncF plasmid conjugative transfer pilus assembly protein TraB [Azospirillum argentinense]